MARALNVTWQNFRGFKEATDLRLPGLTLLIGRNNVGKTSAYAPLLLLRQTLDARDPKTALLARGSLIDAGSYKDFVFQHDTSEQVRLSVSLPSGPKYVRDSEDRPRRMDLTFDSVDGNIARLYRHRLTDDRQRPIVTRTLEKDGETYSVTSRMLPTSGSVGRPMKEVTELRSSMREERPEGFLFEGYGGLLLPRRWRENAERWAKVQDWYNAASNLVDVHQEANYAIRTLLRQIAYLGPLRSLPQRTYRLDAEPPTEVGREGQYAPELLFRQRDSELGDTVNAWLQELGYGSLDFESLGEDYFQCFVRKDRDFRVNIAHSGVGLSQLLPLLVQGVSSGPGATLIAQQPEIHLNPAQQSIMTDFLLSLVGGERRVIVETHSEHVLLRLRRRIAEGAIDAADVAVYYFDNRNGKVSVEPVDISDAGAIDRNQWPTGFFEDQLTESFALAVAQSRRQGAS